MVSVLYYKLAKYCYILYIWHPVGTLTEFLIKSGWKYIQGLLRTDCG